LKNISKLPRPIVLNEHISTQYVTLNYLTLVMNLIPVHDNNVMYIL